MKSNKYIPRLYNNGGLGNNIPAGAENMILNIAPGEPITSPIPKGEPYYPRK